MSAELSDSNIPVISTDNIVAKNRSYVRISPVVTTSIIGTTITGTDASLTSATVSGGITGKTFTLDGVPITNIRQTPSQIAVKRWFDPNEPMTFTLDSGNANPFSYCYDGRFIFVVARKSGNFYLYKIDPASGEIKNTPVLVQTGSAYLPSNMIFDGYYIWVGNSAGVLIQYSPISDTIIASYNISGSVGGYGISGICVDDSRCIWVIGGNICLFDPPSGSVVQTVSFTSNQNSKIVFDGTHIWGSGIVPGQSFVVVKIKPGLRYIKLFPDSGWGYYAPTVVKSFAIDSALRDMIFDGYKIWGASGGNKLTTVNVTTDEVKIIDLAGTPYESYAILSLTFDGYYIWGGCSTNVIMKFNSVTGDPIPHPSGNDRYFHLSYGLGFDGSKIWGGGGYSSSVMAVL